ncbi:MAG: CRISPR-associated helicase Cas3' [Chloroflexota bacterium]
MDIPKHFLLWAKTDQIGGENIHPLIYHLIDVGECTLALWNLALSEQTRQTFASYLDLDVEATGRLLTFWASLHDLGKASPGFQRKYSQWIPLLEREGFVFPKDVSPNPAPHAILTTWALKENFFVQETGLTLRDAKLIAFALGGHHGAWPTTDRIQSPSLQKSDKGDGLWDTVRKDLLLVLKEVYQPVATVNLPKDQDELNAFLTLFSGLVSVADWIGSMVENFPFMEDYLPAGKYVSDYARKQANDALERLGWLGWQADGNLLTFAAMFPDIQINAIQQKAIESAAGRELPALVILEAPTGIGKTEAALFLADAWLQTQKGKGIYIAMPTQATSNQMFERTTNFLVNRYPAQSINTHLVHGAALLKDDEKPPQPQGIAEDDKAAEGNVKAETWFLPRKRTLLAPFGVGTVDQALMSVLQTNHFFVRMFGLGQKVVIFDEVHAYDTYMSTLFQRLLRWLRSIGTSVILLSATLPEKTRQELVGAWLGDEDITLPPAAYPRLTVVGSSKPEIIELPSPESRTLQLAWVDPASEQVADHLAKKLKDGGCAAVICNRVKRAQEVYETLKSKGIVDEKNLILFHARFPFSWRKNIEDRVLEIFGKDKNHPDQPNPNRPQKAIVVATQVIEQSLDLDFDYMLTDLAPIDLLLQRAGRLHRHKQNNQNRPQAVKSTCLAITRSPEKDNLPDFGLDARIYDKATLLRTWQILRGREGLSLPEETSRLIETVYGETLNEGELDPVFQQALRDADEKGRLARDKETAQAKQRMVALPSYEDLLTDRNEGLEEDDPKVNEAFRALTRLAEPSVALICLHDTVQGFAFDADGTGAPVEIKKRPNLQLAKKLLRRAVNVQRRDVVEYFVKNVKTSAAWRESAAVRYHYPVVFDQNDECQPEGAGFTLKLTRELGLEVFKKEDQ